MPSLVTLLDGPTIDTLSNLLPVSFIVELDRIPKLFIFVESPGAFGSLAQLWVEVLMVP